MRHANVLSAGDAGDVSPVAVEIRVQRVRDRLVRRCERVPAPGLVVPPVIDAVGDVCDQKNAFLTMRCASFATLAQERYVGMPAPQFILQSPRC